MIYKYLIHLVSVVETLDVYCIIAWHMMIALTC